MHLLEVKGVSKKDDNNFHLHNINFRQKERQNIAVAGETGSGKTTLLKIIAGLSQPDHGAVIFKGEKVIGPADKLIPGHKGIVYLPQNFKLPGFLRVEQILEYASEWSVAEAEKLFRLCRISHLFKRRTDQLSGGEQQRIAIARLLVMDPQLFLLDEPFSNMDMANKNLLKNIIRDISKELNMSFIMISHDPNDTLSWADEILVMKDGNNIERNNPETIYTRPHYEYTAGLFGKYNEIPASLLNLFNDRLSDGHEGKIAIARPEQCIIMPADSNNMYGIPGIVLHNRYYGHYTETDIMANGQVMSCRSDTTDNKVGDKIILQIHENAIHFVQRI